MSIWLQHLLVLSAVGACVAFAGWQGVKTLVGKRSRLGSCCSKGCGADEKKADTSPGKTEQVQFIPVEMLSRRK